jgi:hypothetical protein
MKKINFLKKSTSLALTAAFALSISACGARTAFNTDLSQDQISSFGQTRTDATGKKKWTFLVHLAADNNLYGFGLKDMSEMAYGLNSSDVNVVVLFDGAKTGDSAVYEVKHSDKKPAMNAPISSPKVANPIVPASNEIDSGDPKVFAKFMDWATKTYPAEHTAVVIWNHGSGIFRNGSTFKPKNSKKGTPGQITTNGFSWDDHGGNMDLRDLDPAFNGAMVNTGKKLDILDFDACLMSHVEAAYQIKDNVNYLVASEKTEAGDGNDYIGILKALSANPDMSGAQFATAMVDSYAKSYVPGGNQYAGHKEEYTLSATDTSALVSGLVPAINDLATELTKNPAMAKTSWDSATTYDGDPEPRDLGHFVTLLARDQKAASAKAKADVVLTELKKTVIREVHTDKVMTNGLSDSSGLVIYFPGPGDSINSKYLNVSDIKFAEQPAWGNFLKAFTKGSR